VSNNEVSNSEMSTDPVPTTEVPTTEVPNTEVSETQVSDNVAPNNEVPDGENAPELTNTVSDPAKLIRLGSMVQALMAEVRSASPDEAGRSLLARIHNETMSELSEVLSPDLMAELAEFQTCCEGDTPSESEIRIAQAQLVGWLQGLLQGFQASAAAQQTQASQQLQQMRPGPGSGEAEPRPGTYL
jgi:hypothetical protein